MTFSDQSEKGKNKNETKSIHQCEQCCVGLGWVGLGAGKKEIGGREEGKESEKSSPGVFVPQDLISINLWRRAKRIQSSIRKKKKKKKNEK